VWNCTDQLTTDRLRHADLHGQLHPPEDPGRAAREGGVAFLPFSDVRQSVLDDIKVVKENKLLLDVPVTGYIYDVKTGKVEKV